MRVLRRWSIRPGLRHRQRERFHEVRVDPRRVLRFVSGSRWAPSVGDDYRPRAIVWEEVPQGKHFRATSAPVAEGWDWAGLGLSSPRPPPGTRRLGRQLKANTPIAGSQRACKSA